MKNRNLLNTHCKKNFEILPVNIFIITVDLVSRLIITLFCFIVVFQTWEALTYNNKWEGTFGFKIITNSLMSVLAEYLVPSYIPLNKLLQGY
jgi:hypothetical protein